MKGFDLLDTAAGRIAVWAAGVAGGLYLLQLAWRALVRSIRGGRRAVTTVHRLGDALLGDPETGKLGMDERVTHIEEQLLPNGGGSLRDVANRSEQKIDATQADLTALREEFAAHLAEHARTAPVHLHVSSAPVPPQGA